MEDETDPLAIDLGTQVANGDISLAEVPIVFADDAGNLSEMVPCNNEAASKEQTSTSAYESGIKYKTAAGEEKCLPPIAKCVKEKLSRKRCASRRPGSREIRSSPSKSFKPSLDTVPLLIPSPTQEAAPSAKKRAAVADAAKGNRKKKKEEEDDLRCMFKCSACPLTSVDRGSLYVHIWERHPRGADVVTVK